MSEFSEKRSYWEGDETWIVQENPRGGNLIAKTYKEKYAKEIVQLPEIIDLLNTLANENIKEDSNLHDLANRIRGISEIARCLLLKMGQVHDAASDNGKGGE